MRLFAPLAIAVLALADQAAAASVTNCAAMEPCFNITFEKLTDTNCGGLTGKCVVEVCMVVDTEKCAKGGDSISHMCDGADASGCQYNQTSPLFDAGDYGGNSKQACPAVVGKDAGGLGVAAKCEDVTQITMCQEAVPGQSVYFILKDGQNKDQNTTLESVEWGTKGNKCGDHYMKCTNGVHDCSNDNQQFKERTFEIYVPDVCDCGCDDRNNTDYDPTCATPVPSLAPSLVSSSPPTVPREDATVPPIKARSQSPSTGPTAPLSSPPSSGPTAPLSSPPSSGPTATLSSPPSSGPTATLSSPPSSGPTAPLSSPPSSGPTAPLSSPPSTGPTATLSSPPSTGPTATLSSPPSASPVPPPTTSHGDPHFRTFKGEHFEYHGQCDLVLAKDPTFADGLGLDIQIRTKLVRFWSYIKQAAIRIGDDILEIEGNADETDQVSNYWVNLEYQGGRKHYNNNIKKNSEVAKLGGFPVTLEVGSPVKRSYTIDLSSKYPGVKIVISNYKEFVRIDLQGASEEAFGNTVGLFGDFKTGKTLGRDGVRELDDFAEFGHEWQVLPSENMLFRDVSEPQFPAKCIEPEDPRGERRRRLDESSISEEQAEKACARLKDAVDRKDCVYDILATQDIDMVGAY